MLETSTTNGETEVTTEYKEDIDGSENAEESGSEKSAPTRSNTTENTFL